jgi:predicted transcriptional regulator
MADQATLAKMASDIESIKKLVIFALMNQGHSQSKIAAALGTSQASVSRMFSKPNAKED